MMKNTLTKNMTKLPKRRNAGFTLIEMLVVAALIAIFAGLAVYNIVELLNREKEKAAIAETRAIATALSFAYDDLGFFPKLSFLQYGIEDMKRFMNAGTALPGGVIQQDEIDYYGFATPTMQTMITNKWREKYMAGTSPNKTVIMQINPTDREMNWPADPFMQPYVLYLAKVAPPPGNPTGVPVISWVNSAGDEPNYFAGVVSYGRNKVAGLEWDATSAHPQYAAREAGRLYTPVAGTDRTFRQLRLGDHNAARLNLLVEESADPDNAPNIRDPKTDDKFYEF